MRQRTSLHTVHDVICNEQGTPIGERGLELCVVATTDAGTRTALAAARCLSAGLDPRIAVVVPHAVPYPQPLTPEGATLAFAKRRIRALVEHAGVEALVHVCVCRPGADGLERVVPSDAIVLVGGARRRWWPTRAQRLANRLTERGHRVLFIDATPRARPSIAATSCR